MQLRKEEKKQRFEEIVILYQKSEFTQENWHKNEWKDWKHNEETWHTKARWPEQGLHLVVYHLGSDDKMGYRNGFIIIKDYRFINGENYLPLRIELEPTYDTKRKTRTYYVIRNEFGKREFYQKFYRRMKDSEMTLETYEEVLNENKKGLWKKHLIRIQKYKNEITWIPLRFNLNKNQWKKVIDKKSFIGVSITRQLGRNWKDNKELASEVIAYANEEGVFNISEELIETGES